MAEKMVTGVKDKFSAFPPTVRDRLLFVRRLIFEAASESGLDGKVEESLKWGEPSYRTRHGSTLRLDWKAATPDRYFVYFHCRTGLIDTFRELYRDRFEFDGNRAIVFRLNQDIPQAELKQCISMALNYHRIKHLPLLGA